MNSISEIVGFIFSNGDDLICNDRYEKTIISGIVRKKTSLRSEGNLNNFFNNISDEWSLRITLNDDENLLTCSNSIDQNFVSEYNAIQLLQDDKLSIKLEIYKDSKEFNRNVYCEKSFNEWVESRSAIELLKTISNDIKRNGFVNFNMIENKQTHLYSKRVRVNDSTFVNKNFKTYPEYSNFDQNNEYPYIGSDFKVLDHNLSCLFLPSRLTNLSNLFSITSLFDVTYLQGNILFYKLKGYKFFQGKLPVKDLTKNYDIYSKINNWIFDDSANIADKLGISKNIISLHITPNNIVLNDSVFSSILSGHKIYLKENVSQYLKVRSKINDELADILKEIRNSLQELRTNYQKSNFLYISFFMSVYVIRTLIKKDFEQIFTKDTTVLFFAFIGISIIYLIYTIWSVITMRDRIKKHYQNVKAKNLDIMEKSDIERILKNDSEFDDEISYFNTRISVYVILWILTMVVLTFAVLYLSKAI
ncbi:hypothetical protein JoomaDRAFT_3964 [Galbibacter orientalis DSM 19592]|uniref:Uncharacterized protein n=1 Tax=Galbibacter orientalis DSM 19592 TaxID=926559 RepID=I3CB94_9FLAO|nr:hypothetical protein [Galbibacter orientalis]EIJ40887.1 hypothetical protein JoomaDRAFT_3964 [Galbibacter orientalis DSM 19592]